MIVLVVFWVNGSSVEGIIFELFESGFCLCVNSVGFSLSEGGVGSIEIKVFGMIGGRVLVFGKISIYFEFEDFVGEWGVVILNYLY